MRATATLSVNGTPHPVSPGPDRPLLHVLREELGFTGTKIGCAEGVCGACTVLIDGAVTRACITPLTEALAHEVTTIEGLATDGALSPLQRSFLAEGAFQCGYCTPGMIMASHGMLAADATPDGASVRAALDGNLCRCGAYGRILRAVAGASTAAPESGPRRVSADDVSVERPWDLSGDHASIFAWLGDGLLVLVDDDGAGAWLHVGSSGRVTVASGKVDVGQGSAAELAGVALANLHAARGDIQVLLGDTDLAPYDPGTFGSRTTPDVVPAVAGAAAAARQTLERLAAAEWGIDAGQVTTADGQVRSLDGERSASVAELVRGLRRVETAASAVAEPLDQPMTFDAADVVTGRRQYATDLLAPDMLHARVVRPPAPGAQLLALDISAVEGVEGARVARDGELIAVLAADLLTAQRGLDAVRATWSPTTGPSDPDLEVHLRAHPAEVEGWGGGVDAGAGDPDGALRGASVGLEATYQTAYLAHDPLETRAALARWGTDGRLTVWTGTQRPFGVRAALTEALDVGEEMVRVIVPPTGSAYGGKHTAEAAEEAARLARAAGVPVRVRWTREEEMAWAYARPAAVIDVRSGVDADGRIVAWEMTNISSGPRAIESPYRIANWHVRYQPAQSPLRQGSYRALSATANTFARESHMDELAHAIGADPLEFRLRHLADERLAAVLRAAAERAGWAENARAPGNGIGLAGSVEKGSYVATVAEVTVAAGGQFQLDRIVTAFECGAILDRDNLLNQVEGALVMGLGGALFEGLSLVDGHVANAHQSAYRVPRFSDLPLIEVVLLDRPDLASQGAGETPIIAIAPAIANAVFTACGTRLRRLPLVPTGRVEAG